MTNPANAAIQYESAQTLVAFKAMTDSGDHTVFTTDSDKIWSGRSGYTVQVRPDGIVSGANILSAGSNANEVDSIAFTAWLSSVLKEVTATSTTITRATTQTHVINSIILTGTTVSAVKGTEGTAFSTTRAAAGGPPYIPVGSIEIGQVKTSAQASAVLTSSEIFQTPGTHQERADYPLYHRPNNIGLGILAPVTAKANAHIQFKTALQACHTGATIRPVYIQYYNPTFTTLEGDGFTPADEATSQSSAQQFGQIVGYGGTRINQSTFRSELQNGVTDALIALDGQDLVFKFFPNVSAAPFMLTYGTLRFAVSFPRMAPLTMACSVTVKLPTARFAT